MTFKQWCKEIGKPQKLHIKSDGSYLKHWELRQMYDIWFGNTTASMPEAKENTMNNNMSVAALNTKQYSVEQDRVEHFTKVRLPKIAYEKERELEKHFGLVDDKRPTTWKELLERIEKKQFVVDEKTEALFETGDFDFFSRCPLDNVRFRDPEKKEDRKGWMEAVKSMHDGMRETEDEIVAHQNDGEKILAALSKFEGKTFH